MDYDIDYLRSLVVQTPDFPEKGVLFRDMTPLLAQEFGATIAAMRDLFSQDEYRDIDGFAGIDARGFIFASALAAQMGKNFVIIRKAGKLPPPSLSASYDLEYGSAEIEMKPGSGRVILVDDVIATGGSLMAAAELCAKAGYDVKGFMTLIDLTFLNDFSWQNMTVRSLIQYES